MDLITFEPRHIPDTLRLSTQVGWNHLEQDWQRCIDLNPGGCVGGVIDGRVVATTTLLKFGDLGWVGTFLVDDAQRRKGLGSIIFAEALERAKAMGITWMALDSSDVGRPIYTRFGFVLDEPIERWTGPAAEGNAAGTEPLADSHWNALLAFDRESSGVDRAFQLRHLAGEAGAAARVISEGSRITAFGFSRPGRLGSTIGPVVADTDMNARAIFESLFADRHRLDGPGRGLALDVLGQENFKGWLTQKNFAMRRRNIRMFHPGRKRPVLTGPQIYAATGLGMG